MVGPVPNVVLSDVYSRSCAEGAESFDFWLQTIESDSEAPAKEKSFTRTEYQPVVVGVNSTISKLLLMEAEAARTVPEHWSSPWKIARSRSASRVSVV